MAPSERERGDGERERERQERGGGERPWTPRGIGGYWNMMREGYDEVRRRLNKPKHPLARPRRSRIGHRARLFLSSW